MERILHALHRQKVSPLKAQGALKAWDFFLSKAYLCYIYFLLKYNNHLASNTSLRCACSLFLCYFSAIFLAFFCVFLLLFLIENKGLG